MRKQVTLLFALAAVLAGCEDPGSGIGENAEDIKFTGIIENWGNGKILEKGDRIGLFAGAPFNRNNLLLTVGDSNSLIAEENLIWKADSTVSSVDFLAYAPYDASFSDFRENFAVAADQSGRTGEKASDLMMAKASVELLSKNVDFEFAHKMVRVAIHFNNTSDDPIVSVTLSDVSVGTSIDLKGGSVATADSSATRGNVLTGLYRNAVGAEYYAAIIPPQVCEITANVVFGSGASKTVSTGNTLSLASGQQWDNASRPIEIGEDDKADPTPVTFTMSISDWEDDIPLQFVRTR